MKRGEGVIFSDLEYSSTDIYSSLDKHFVTVSGIAGLDSSADEKGQS